MDPLTADAPSDDAATTPPPPARLGLLDLMVIVAAFGVGFGVMQILSSGDRGVTRVVFGFLFGATIVPPAVLAVRAIAGRVGAGLRAGELMGLFPFAGWLLAFVGPAIRSHCDPLRGLFHLWTLTQIVAGMWSSWRLVAWSLSPATRRRTGWLEVYSHALNALMMLLAWLLLWATILFS